MGVFLLASWRRRSYGWLDHEVSARAKRLAGHGDPFISPQRASRKAAGRGRIGAQIAQSRPPAHPTAGCPEDRVPSPNSQKMTAEELRLKGLCSKPSCGKPLAPGIKWFCAE